MNSKDWCIYHTLTPGVGAESFQVRGTITVAHPGVTPTLVKAVRQDRSYALNLELKLEQGEGMAIQVLTDKEVCFEMAGNHSDIPWVNVLHEGELLTTVTKVITLK
ncbi:hypothetical protein E1573_11465 [Pseudomonas sp. H9]|nr:hypothetical protein E1573_11465 [Pseudomonas sp. H9]